MREINKLTLIINIIHMVNCFLKVGLVTKRWSYFVLKSLSQKSAFNQTLHVG